MSLYSWFGFLLFVLHSLPVATEDFFPDMSRSAIPVTFGFSFMSILIVVFYAYKWKQNQNKGNKEKEHLKTAERNPINPLHSVQRENNTKDLDKSERTMKDTLQGMRESFPQLKFTLAMLRIQRMEDEINKILQLRVKNPRVAKNEEFLMLELETMKEKQIELEKSKMLMADTVKGMRESFHQLKFALAFHRMQKLEDKKDENQHFQEKNQEMEVLRRELETEKEQVEQLHEENQMMENNLQTLNKELETKNKELCDSKLQIESLMKKNQDFERQLTEMRHKHKQELTSADMNRRQTCEELKETQSQLEKKTADIRNLRREFDDKLKTKMEIKNKELCESKLQFESLKKKNQEFERQLTELQERHKQELEKRLQDEQQWREDVEKEVEMLKKELEKEKQVVLPKATMGAGVSGAEQSLNESDIQEQELEKRLQDEQQWREDVEKEVEMLKKELEKEKQVFLPKAITGAEVPGAEQSLNESDIYLAELVVPVEED
ncbi:interaptin-like isoform X3 [Micropterus salmoides]|uniref:interaptin-like isoform X3 n=1 Tax=Micropterus salmoides TaxID=27706 RepID=UPI0018EC1ABF|nr:interaptin-like isoform X3 [Micropterus salmoides]